MAKKVKAERVPGDATRKGGGGPPEPSERSKALGRALGGIEGFRLWSQVEYPEILRTRITSLNRALRCGGIPGGMLGDVHGPSGGGKSLFCAEVLHSVHATGGWGLMVDAECRAVDLEWYHAVCGNLSEVAYYKPRTYEEAIDRYQAFRDAFRKAKDGGKLPPGAFCGAVFDSVNRLSPASELKEFLEEGIKARGYPLRAGITSRWLDQLIPTLERDEVLVFVRRESQRLDAMPGQKKYTVKGGRSVEYDAGWRLRVTAPARVKTDEKEPRICGQKHEIEVEKNSMGPHLSELANFYSATGIEPGVPKGLDPAREIREESIRAGLVKYKKGTGYLYGGEVVAPSKPAFRAWLLAEDGDGRANWARLARELEDAIGGEVDGDAE